MPERQTESASESEPKPATACGCRTHWHDESVHDLMAKAWNEGWQAGHDDCDQGAETADPHRILSPGPPVGR